MNEPGSGKRIGIILLGVIALVVGMMTALALYGVIPVPQSARLETVHQNLVRKGQLVAALRINLHTSAEAEKSAMMADTDKASVAYAEQSKLASATVEKARKELAELIEEGGERKERDLLNDFSACWERFQEIDRELLPLAVQNTNLKAFDLSFGPASQALKQFETAFTDFMDRNASAQEPPVIAGLSFQAFTAALKIQALQAPHIAFGLFFNAVAVAAGGTGLSPPSPAPWRTISGRSWWFSPRPAWPSPRRSPCWDFHAPHPRLFGHNGPSPCGSKSFHADLTTGDDPWRMVSPIRAKVCLNRKDAKGAKTRTWTESLRSLRLCGSRIKLPPADNLKSYTRSGKDTDESYKRAAAVCVRNSQRPEDHRGQNLGHPPPGRPPHLLIQKARVLQG